MLGRFHLIYRRLFQAWRATLSTTWLNYLRYSMPGWLTVLLFRPFYFWAVPRTQREPLFVYTMGKVGTISIDRALVRAGFTFVFHFHRLNDFQVPTLGARDLINVYRRQIWLKRWAYPWILKNKSVKVITLVRDPIERLLSLYVFNYESFTGKRIEGAQLADLLRDFRKVFEAEYAHSLIPGEFFANEIQTHLGIDVFANRFPVERGWQVFERDNISLMVMRLEISDEEKSTAISNWLGSPQAIKVRQQNTSKNNGMGDAYQDFKLQVSVPRKYAEHMYCSNFMKHFYSDRDREAFQKRWENQFDDTIVLPETLVANLEKYHPKVC